MSEPVFFRDKQSFALISDSHHDMNMVDKLAGALTGIGGVLMLGDGVSDMDHLQKKLRITEVYAVQGNCDLFKSANREMSGRLFRENGPMFYACHGHRYDVKVNTFTLLYRAKEENASVAFYGHTHIPASDREDGVLLVNPGALRDGCYAIVRLEDNALKIEHKRL